MKKPQSRISQAVPPSHQIQDRIRQRAHEIYEARGERTVTIWMTG
jgi:hypothetical protein